MMIGMSRRDSAVSQSQKFENQCPLEDICPLYKSRSPCRPILFQDFRVCSFLQNITGSISVQPRGEPLHFLEDLDIVATCASQTVIKRGEGHTNFPTKLRLIFCRLENSMLPSQYKIFTFNPNFYVLSS